MHVAVSKIPCWHGVPSGAKESWGCSGLTEQGCLPDSHRDIRAAAVSEQCCQRPAVLQKRLAALVVLFQMDKQSAFVSSGHTAVWQWLHFGTQEAVLLHGVCRIRRGRVWVRSDKKRANV